MQAQTCRCYRETENDALMCDYCTCLQIYSYPVVHSDISTTRVVLHSTQKTRASHHVQESCQCIFAALCFHQINPRGCSYQIELVKLGCYYKNKTNLFFYVIFFPQVNKRRGLLLKVSKNLEVRLGKTNKKKQKQEVQSVSFCFYQLIFLFFRSL